MDRNIVYNRWRSKPSSRKKMDMICEENFEMFVNCISALEPSRSQESVNQYKSAIMNFLAAPQIRSVKLQDITHSLIEEYIIRFYDNNSADNSLNSKVRYIKKLFELEAPASLETVDWNALTVKANEIETKNQAQVLNAEQISKCRDIYSRDLRKRYIFEMMLQTSVKDNTIAHFKIASLIESEDDSGKHYAIAESKKRIETIPRYLGKLILEMEMQHKHGFDLKTYVEQMKDDLRPFGIENFKRSDLKSTREKKFFTCPQCGNKYEATEDNWCLKRFVEGQDFWIVCKERCSK